MQASLVLSFLFPADNHAEYDILGNYAQHMLSFAAGCGSSRLFKYVLKKESYLLSNNDFMKNILRTAITGGSIEIVKFLLSKNIPLNNIAYRFVWTPAHYAAANGHAEMIRFLKENNINLDQRILSGKFLYNIAEDNKKDKVMKTIREFHGNISPQRFPRLEGLYLGQESPQNEPKFLRPISFQAQMTMTITAVLPLVQIEKKYTGI
jgi:ankyrin repeat protein